MLSPQRFLLTPFLAVMLAAMSASEASAQRVEITAQVIEATVTGGVLDVQFRINVTNGESSVASNVGVAFEDGVVVAIGDVDAEGSAISAIERRTVDISTVDTHTVSVPVTVKFSLDGTSVELARPLFIHFEPATGGQQ
jgi:hypothetical protein